MKKININVFIISTYFCCRHLCIILSLFVIVSVLKHNSPKKSVLSDVSQEKNISNIFNKYDLVMNTEFRNTEQIEAVTELITDRLNKYIKMNEYLPNFIKKQENNSLLYNNNNIEYNELQKYYIIILINYYYNNLNELKNNTIKQYIINGNEFVNVLLSRNNNNVIKLSENDLFVYNKYKNTIKLFNNITNKCINYMKKYLIINELLKQNIIKKN